MTVKTPNGLDTGLASHLTELGQKTKSFSNSHKNEKVSLENTQGVKYGESTRQIRQHLSGTGVPFDLSSPWFWLPTLGAGTTASGIIGHNSNKKKLFTVDLKVHLK